MAVDDRKCGECTACCQGWLSATIHGKSMYPGKPCHFLGNNCTIYKSRPHDPCVTYKCAYLLSKDIPEWLRPDRCGAILTWREKDGVKWVEAQEMGKRLDSRVLSWLFIEMRGKGVNIRWMIDGAWNWFGDTAFGAVMNAIDKGIEKNV